MPGVDRRFLPVRNSEAGEKAAFLLTVDQCSSPVKMLFILFIPCILAYKGFLCLARMQGMKGIIWNVQASVFLS
jgi:hypothetical protein